MNMCILRIADNRWRKIILTCWMEKKKKKRKSRNEEGKCRRKSDETEEPNSQWRGKPANMAKSD
jgi:hypothetical protein